MSEDCDNYDLLNYLLDDLMAWHKECYDFSLLEVNRYAHLCTMQPYSKLIAH